MSSQRSIAKKKTNVSQLQSKAKLNFFVQNLTTKLNFLRSVSKEILLLILKLNFKLNIKNL